MTKKASEAKRPNYTFNGKLKAYKTSGNGVVIEGFANAATVDRSKELIDPEAFTKTKGLDNFMKNPTILFDHGMHPQIGALPIGKAIEINATENGLFVKAKLSQSKDPPISTIRTLVEEGNLRAFSVGFNPEEVDGPDDKGVSTIKSAELFEISVVGIPMNQDSLFNVTTKSGKKILAKSYSKIVAEICHAKGATYAEAANLKIDDMTKSNETDRADIVAAIAEKAGVSEAVVLDVLSGALVDIPKQLLDAFKAVIGDIDIKEFPPEKDDDDDDEDKDDDEKTKADEPKDDDDSDDSDDDDDTEDKGKKDFQDCVNEKIPKLIEEGKDQDEAVATAISMCRDSTKCAIEPDKAMFETFLKTVDECTKQADQSEAGVPDVTEPIRTTTPDSEMGASPMLEQTKQSNVLLGTLVNEFKLFSEGFRGMTEDIVNAIAALDGKLSDTGASKKPKDEVTMDDDDDDDKNSESEETQKRVAKVKSHLDNLASRLEKLGVSLTDKEQ